MIIKIKITFRKFSEYISLKSVTSIILIYETLKILQYNCMKIILIEKLHHKLI